MEAKENPVPYPSKVQRILDRIARANREWPERAWQNVEVEERDGLWIIRAERPGNVFTAERLSLYVAARKGYVIEGTDIRMNASQRFQGGRISRFGSDVEIDGWKTLYRIG